MKKAGAQKTGGLLRPHAWSVMPGSRRMGRGQHPQTRNHPLPPGSPSWAALSALTSCCCRCCAGPDLPLHLYSRAVLSGLERKDAQQDPLALRHDLLMQWEINGCLHPRGTPSCLECNNWARGPPSDDLSMTVGGATNLAVGTSDASAAGSTAAMCTRAGSRLPSSGSRRNGRASAGPAPAAQQSTWGHSAHSLGGAETLWQQDTKAIATWVMSLVLSRLGKVSCQIQIGPSANKTWSRTGRAQRHARPVRLSTSFAHLTGHPMGRAGQHQPAPALGGGEAHCQWTPGDPEGAGQSPSGLWGRPPGRGD